MSFTLLYTDSENQQREQTLASVDLAKMYFTLSGGIKGEIYNARSLAMYHAGIRPYPPVVIERLYCDDCVTSPL